MRRKEDIQESFDLIRKNYSTINLKGVRKLDRTEALIQALQLTVEVLCDIRSNMVGIMKAIHPDSDQERNDSIEKFSNKLLDDEEYSIGR